MSHRFKKFIILRSQKVLGFFLVNTLFLTHKHILLLKKFSICLLVCTLTQKNRVTTFLPSHPCVAAPNPLHQNLFVLSLLPAPRRFSQNCDNQRRAHKLQKGDTSLFLKAPFMKQNSSKGIFQKYSVRNCQTLHSYEKY